MSRPGPDARGHTLVVAATSAEAAHVPSGFPIVITGLGKIDAAIAVMSALASHQVSEVINVRTAGALRPGLEGLFIPSTVLNHDISSEVLRTLGYEVCDELELEGDGTVLATGDTFVTDPVVRDALARRAHLVDMEGFAIARACASADVRCRLVKHVSDQADESALDWPARIDASARALGQWLDRAVR